MNSYKNEKTRLEKLGSKNPGEKAIVKILSTDSDQNNVKRIMLYGYVMPLAWQYVASGLVQGDHDFILIKILITYFILFA